jgi:hypothetical protein
LFYWWQLPWNHYFVSLPEFDWEKFDYVSDIVELFGDSDDKRVDGHVPYPIERKE